jgi:hypothetical protein
VPDAARLAVGAVLLLTVAVLAGAATSKGSYRRTRLAVPGGIALIALDMTMIIAVLTIAPAVTWVLTTAAAASLTRIGLVLKLVPRAIVR